MGAFKYVVPPILEDTEIYLCVDLVLPMVLVNSPPLFCTASETAVYLDNTYLENPETPWRYYAPIKEIYVNAPNDTTSANRLRKVQLYMDNFMGMTQQDPTVAKS